MTFLQLVQRLRLETNYANTGPTTVTGQTGDHERAVAWIASAYSEIQARHDWRWMRKQFTLTLSSSVDTYDYTSCIDSATSTAISRFKSWAITDPWNPPKIYLQSAGSGAESWVTFVPWENFRSVYRIGTQTEGAPAHVTIDPSDNLVFGPEPNDTYIFTGEYNRGSQTLTANSDEPDMPSDGHLLIVYEAMEKYGAYNSASEVLTRAQVEGRPMMRRLEKTQLPRMRTARPMV